MGNAEETAVYVYAVTREGPEAEAAVAALPGVLGTPVRTVSEGGLTALAGLVPADLFGEEALKRQLEDLEQLESMARAHHAVVEAVTARTLALPLRLATVYLDEYRVREMLKERAGEFEALLGRLEGHLELGVKVYADPRHRPAAPGPSVGGAQEPEPRSAAVSPGRAYLQQRRMQRRSREDAYRRAEQAAAAVAAEAERIAVDRVRHRLQQGELAAGPGQNIANDAYLVPAGQAEEFRRRVRAAGEAPGVRVEVTGPWAPYSFATPPATAPVPAGEGPVGGAVAGAPGTGER